MLKSVIIYTHVSTSEQADKGFSLAHQEKMLRLYCQANKLEIVNHFEEDFSAKNFDRPQWKLLEEYVKNNKSNIDAVLCLKWDRFSRNTGESYNVIKRFKNKYGVEINAIDQRIDFTVSESKMMLSLYLTVPEIENDKNSQRTIAGSRQARLEGCWTGKAPFGYKNVRTTTGKSTLEKTASAEIVLTAFQEFSSGLYSAEDIRRRMYSKGLKLRKMAFLNLLRNQVYRGVVYVKEYGKESSLVVPGLHEAIVDDYTFNKVQALLTKRTKNKVSVKPQNIEELPLRGHLICKKCGGNLTGSKSKGRNAFYYYYHCNNNQCKERFRADWANSTFNKTLATFYFEPEIVELYGQILEDCYKRDNECISDTLKSYEKEIEKAKNKIIQIQDLLVEEKISSQDYSDMKSRYEKSLNEMIMTYTELSMATKRNIEHLKFGVCLLKELPRFYSDASLEGKRQIIGSIYPEKLEFHNGEYRTTKTNAFFEIMNLKFKELEKYKNKNANISAGVYSKAPPSGLEPETL